LLCQSRQQVTANKAGCAGNKGFHFTNLRNTILSGAARRLSKVKERVPRSRRMWFEQLQIFAARHSSARL
jgi:hypothetical protein